MGKKNRQRRLPRISKSKVTTFVIVIGIIAVVGYDFYQRSQRPARDSVPAQRTKGSRSADFKIVEYADFQCSHCALGYSLLKRYLYAYPEEIYLEMKYYPLAGQNSLISAIYAECAAQQNQFWRMHDLLFERQSQWRTLSNAESFLKIIARDAGLNRDILASCVADGEARATVLAEKAYGESLFIQITPTYFINGKMTVGPESLRAVLEKEFGYL